MLTPRKKDTIHKSWLMKILTEIADNTCLSQKLYFKGGTCAAMRGFIDRFSVDLDFDIPCIYDDLTDIENQLEQCFFDIGLEIKNKSTKVPQYFLKYPSPKNTRNTIKIDVLYPAHQYNKYKKIRLLDIDRILICQTKETLFANKMVAVLDRYARHGNIAGRDIFDIYHFFLQGLSYNKEVIYERTSLTAHEFLLKLMRFIEIHINQTIIDQDLNLLLPADTFRIARKNLKQETLMLISDEISRLSKL